MDKTTDLLSTYASILTYEQLPARVVQHVKRTLIDTVGCALGGFKMEPSRMARRMARQCSCASPARVLCTNDLSTEDAACFANGCMIRCLDFNDAYPSLSGGHPSDMIAPILAVADSVKCDGASVITAIVVAYEVFCRISDQVVVGDLGWDHGALVAIGAACGVGKLLDLDRQKLGHAISLAAVANLSLGVTRAGELAMWKGCATAAASRSAILASRLAEMGMTAPAFPFEGSCGFWQQFSGQSVDIGAMGHGEYRIQSSAIKQYPSQTHTQGPISLAVELRSQVSVSDIAYIRLRTYEKAVSSAAAEPEKWAPKNRETADHSIPYLVAYAFHYGAVTPHSFSDKYLHDPSIQALTELIDIEEDPDFTVRFPNEYNCHMELITRSGERSEASVVHPKGFPDNALSDSELEGKFLSLAVDLLSTGQLNGALDVLWSLESATDLTALLDNIVVRP